MRTNIFAMSLLTLVVLATLVTTSSIRKSGMPTDAGNGPPASPIPGFPEDESKLIADREDSTAIKASADTNGHGWRLFNQLVLGKRTPLWGTWCSIGDDDRGETLICPKESGLLPDAFANTKDLDDEIESRNKIQVLLSARHPRQLPEEAAQPRDFGVSDPSLLQASEVLFDPASAKKIEDCFGTGKKESIGKFSKIHLGAPKADCTSFDLPKSAVAIKTIWVPVAHEDTGFMGEKPISITKQIPSWNSFTLPSIDASHFASFGSFRDWNTAAELNLTEDTCNPQSAWVPALAAGPPAFYIPLGCFYSVKANESDIKQAAQIAKINLVPHPGMSDTSTVYLVLLGFHVATREIDGWTWQTFSWSGSAPSEGNPGYSNVNPSSTALSTSLDAHWSHYTMKTTFGDPEASPKPSVAFNPYLEGTSTNGVNSNCYNCHNYAFYHTDFNADSCVYSAKDYFDAAQDFGLGIPVPPNPHGIAKCSLTPRVFGSTGSPVKTAFLWSIADSNTGGNGHLETLGFLQRLDTYLSKVEARRRQHLVPHRGNATSK